MTGADWADAVAAVSGLPASAPVLLVCHVNPDGDALGSMLAFGLGLRRLGYRAVQASFPEPFEVTEPFLGLPGLDLLVPPAEAVAEPALFVCFDASSADRLGALAGRLAAPSVVVDHHASNTRFGKINLVDPAAAATTVLVAGLLDRLGVPLDRAIAECLYVGLVTDTGSFRYEATTPAVHELAARLVATGIDVGTLSRRLFDTRPYAAVRLLAEAVGRIVLEPSAARGLGLAWTYATVDDLARYGQRPYALEPLVDSVRAVAEADVAAVFKQVGPDGWAVSLRSRGGTDVSRVAVALGGGGHRLAAGFTGYGSLDRVLDALRTVLDG